MIKEDISDFQKGYAQKYHHYITIGYITKCPELELPEEPGHFYLSEIPSYEGIDENLSAVTVDSEQSTNIAKPIMQEEALLIKRSVPAGQFIDLEKEKVCKVELHVIVYFVSTSVAIILHPNAFITSMFSLFLSFSPLIFSDFENNSIHFCRICV